MQRCDAILKSISFRRHVPAGIPAGTWRKIDVALTSIRHNDVADVDTTSFWHIMPTGMASLRDTATTYMF